jgi:hypothetical protein
VELVGGTLNLVVLVGIVIVVALALIGSSRRKQAMGVPDPRAPAQPRARSSRIGRDRLEPVPVDASSHVDVECHDKLAVYQNDLEFHVLMDPERTASFRMEIPRAWLELEHVALLAELSNAVDAVYLELRREWVSGDEVSYPALVRAEFRVRAASEPIDETDARIVYDVDEEGAVARR